MNKTLKWVIIVFFLVTSIFDFGSTYKIYEENEELFLDHERNCFLVTSVKHGIPFFLSPIILLNFVAIILLIKKKKWDSNGDRGMWYLIMVGGGILHIWGGISWL